MSKHIRKIIYFDKETIRNILQEKNKGDRHTQTETSNSVQASAEVASEAEANIKLDIPFLWRFRFLLTGRMAASFLIRRESETTLTSTEISEFDTLKPALTEIKDIQLTDIENSSTSFRVAGSYLRLVKGQFADIDVKEFNTVMNDFEGYDTYRVDDKRYVRFNNLAFVSNYKRNDLLSTKMTLYCIRVGSFSKKVFDFMEQLDRMQDMFGSVNSGKTLADKYLQHSSVPTPTDTPCAESACKGERNGACEVELYDAVYACISEKSDDNGKAEVE